MPSPLYIALRFIGHRKKAIILSLGGIVLGVAFFICTQAQTQGFERFYIQTVLGTSGAIVVQDRFQDRYSGALQDEGNALVSLKNERPRKYYPGITDADQVMRAIQEFSNVIACAPVLEDSASLQIDFRSEVFRLQGIDLDAQLRATNLRSYLIDGDLNAFRQKASGLLVGVLLAQKLNLQVGDTVSILGANGETRNFDVSGIFRTGDNMIDERRGYVHLRVAQSLLNRPSEVSYIIVKLRDVDRAPQLAAHLEELLQHRSRSWQERERGNLEIFKAIRYSAAITVSTIIVLAGFGIFNILTLMVLEKVREIAILRSMGYQRSDISAIFLWQGLLIAVIGSTAGCILGALLTWGVSRIPVRVRGFFATDHFLVYWSWHHYVAAIAIAFVGVFIASYFPARRAATLAPVTILRGSGQ
ncbi:MAG TPA: ABC transporter permease [Verrucomicrobiae bacterium]|nr:ABC transporter permease [Verrucomicrobiae bacterium]